MLRKREPTTPGEILREVLPAPLLRASKKRRLSDLYGALPATRPFPGKEEVRESVGLELGKALRRAGS